MMKQSISIAEFRNHNMNCIYNADRFSESEIMVLLSAGASKLFSQKKQIYETENATSYRLRIDGDFYFGKEFKIDRWYRRMWNCFFPACKNNFRAGVKILEAGLPTPHPYIAASLRENGSRNQILVTAFCDNAVGLDDLTNCYKEGERLAILEQVADLLAEVFKKGFYSRHLRSANILVSKKNGRYRFWLIDLDRMGSSRFLPRSAFIHMVSRASFEFYGHLHPDERKYWIQSCFKAGVNNHILSSSCDENNFSNQVVAQIIKRHPMIFQNSEYVK
ncbi:MAG: lipopolysaccharide kinase InaA family protein [Desulfobacterales bacterium]